MKVWYLVYNSHVPILQRQSRYELHFQKLVDFTAKSWESKQRNSWDSITFKYLDLYFTRRKLLLLLVSRRSPVVCMYTSIYLWYIYLWFLIWPLSCFLQQNCRMFLQLRRCEGRKVLNFIFCYHPYHLLLSFHPKSSQLPLATPSYHHSLLCHLLIPSREGYDEHGVSAKAALQSPVQRSLTAVYTARRRLAEFYAMWKVNPCTPLPSNVNRNIWVGLAS